MVVIVGSSAFDIVPQISEKYQVEITNFIYLSHNELQINCPARKRNSASLAESGTSLGAFAELSQPPLQESPRRLLFR